MNELEQRLAAANPVPHDGPDRSVPPIGAVWARVNEPAHTARRATRWLALGGLSTTAAAIVAAVLLLGASDGGPTNAFAAWRATPTAASPRALSTGQQRCGQSEPPALVDTRGPFDSYLFKTGQRQLVECKVWPRGVISWSDPQPMGERAAPDSITTSTCLSARYGGPKIGSHVYLFMFGLAGAGVTQVTVRLRGGPTVRATTSNGLWFAWWPGGNRHIAIELTTEAGTILLRHPPTSPNCTA